MYLATSSSLLRLLQDEILLVSSPVGLDVVDWSAHSQIMELSDKDIVGLGGLVITDNDEMWDVSFAVTIVTFRDKNVFRLKGLVDHFFRRLRPRQQVKIYRPDTAAVVGTLALIDGTEVSDVARA